MKNQGYKTFDAMCKSLFRTIFWLSFGIVLYSCETEIDLELPAGDPQMVVQGHIEPGKAPVVVLTRSVPVFGKVSASDVANSFVHQAMVTVRSGNQEYALHEISAASLTPEAIQQVSELFGLPVDVKTGKLPFEFYFYTSVDLKGEAGKNYRLRIAAEGTVLNAVTSIPHLNPVDSLWFKPHPDPQNDSLFTLWYRYEDPDTLGNCVRYFTKRNREAFYPGYFSSVFIDEFVNGKPYIDFSLQRGEPKTGTPDFNTFGFFKKGDTVTVKWSAIDVAQYRFWNSLETEFSSIGNPIGSPTILQSNIQGGLGIWGGYGTTYHTIVAPR